MLAAESRWVSSSAPDAPSIAEWIDPPRALGTGDEPSGHDPGDGGPRRTVLAHVSRLTLQPGGPSPLADSTRRHSVRPASNGMSFRWTINFSAPQCVSPAIGRMRKILRRK